MLRYISNGGMQMSNGKKPKKVLICIVIVLAVLILSAAIVFRNELHSLFTLRKLDDHGMYSMTYFGDYGFDDFLKEGAESDSDIEKFVTKRLLKGLPIDLGVTGAGCTAFAVKDENGDVIFARNFDFLYAPSLQLYTDPENGYASVSTVNLSFAGYSDEKLPHRLNPDSFLTLAAPFLPFDGMNEKGVAIALLAVPEAQPPYSDGNITLNTTAVIRLVLDKAATTDEAVELLKQYNIYFSGDIPCHYLICDADGDSVIVEYYNNEIYTVKTDDDYQIASNFIAYNDLNIGEGYSEFERYDKVKECIEENGGVLDRKKAEALLAEVGVVDDNTDKLQWSVIYDLSNGNGSIFAHRNTDNIVDFHLDTDKTDGYPD